MNENKGRKYTRRDFLRVTSVGATALMTAACGGTGTTQTPPAAQTAGAASSTAAPATTAAAAASPPAAATLVSKGQTLKVAGYVNPAATEAFMKKFPEIGVEVTELTGADWEENFSLVLSQMAAGNPPDLVFCATEGTQLFAGKGLAAPLDDYVKRDQAELMEYFADVHPSLIEAMMYEGSLYELTVDFNAANMFINTALLKEAGFDYPPPDWTKDQFYEMAKAMTKKDASGQTQNFGYHWVNRHWGGWMPWIFANGSNLLTEERAPGGEWVWNTFYKDDAAAKGRGGGWRWNAPKANDPLNVEALEFMVQLTKEGIAPVPEQGGGSAVQGFFTSNKLGMTPAGGFWPNGLHAAGMAPDSFDVQLWPKWKTQRHQFGVVGYTLMKEATDKDAGWEFIKFLSSKEGMARQLLNETKTPGSTPTRRSMLIPEAWEVSGPAHWQVFYDTLEKHPDTAPIPAPPEANQMATIFVNYTGLAMNFDMTPKEALDQMQAELEPLFAKRTS